MTESAWSVAALALALFGCTAPPPPTNTPAPTAKQGDFSLDPLTVKTRVEKVVLRNGLTVLLDPDHRVPLVAVRVVHPVGWAADPTERVGLAHLVEHLLFQGSRHVADGMHFRLLHDAGADFINGMTAVDRTDFWELLPSSELALALWLESDRMSSGLETLTEAVVEKERRIVARERAERIENVPNGRVDEIMNDFLFAPGHPFRALRIAGSGLDRTTLEEARDFHRRHYSPSNALLVLSGDFDVTDAKALVRHYFEPIPPRPTARIPDLPPASSTPALLRIEARIDAPSLVISWPSAAAFAPGDAELDVVASYLQVVALQGLVRDARILTSAFVRQRSEKSSSTFHIAAGLPTGADPSAALASIDSALDEIRRRGIDASNVHRFAYGWLFELNFDREDLLTRSWLIAHSELASNDADFIAGAVERYRAITPATVREAIERHLRNEHRVVAFVTPNAQAPIAGKLVGQ
jgi:predicted Zn-dependent peptidase